MYIRKRMNFRINWEALGVAASIACAVHCAILPLFLTSLPLFGVNIIENILIETLLLGVAFIVGFSTLWHGYKKHHHRAITLILFTAGMTLFILNQFVKFSFSTLLFIFPAVGLVVIAHILNHHYCKIANHCHATDCKH